MNIRPIPKEPCNRYIGEGDIVLRDKNGRIMAWKSGYDDDSWKKLQKCNKGSYNSIARYDLDSQSIV